MSARTPVRIRGVIYPSQRAAAKALGVSPASVNNALERGAEDSIGLGRQNNNARPVTIDGVTYRSRAEAARRLGISKHEVRKREDSKRGR